MNIATALKRSYAAVKRLVARIVRAVRRTCRLLKAAATDPLIPRPLRWMLIFGLLPIPGPVDDAVLIVAAILLLTLYRPRLRQLAKESK